ncbi:MAG: TetR family transcriptional regulator [Pseudanabaena sp.]|jgi:AcrR family transcriptional regulator|nr:TetR family transcriptional regulator [Pseudanabaena sp. M53BS1SP1A06MG]MCA6588389.1 TetR family transcriptional regulator [Pseudanabaena sp. M109S1SP1A06QC]MCA6594719.1 TetR family transcriptional regulator [Pseudanabaena sp. M38BS1SP1A06MG]MCA6602913.1 TetR family transcriptional regulator [Pseudanabaena sp. M007S1SP1A06QC]MCA6611313.1 TetR family transcriptional regulator [Pseudanabaena sp. M158S2SP1A06QC]MCA6614707.1 TetR family transcriptional regulator [Pseudanabaena sp. M090S1SP1A06Q
MVHAPMSVSRIPTRQRIVNTALELFASKGITETTTRQIADFAQVNEVTLFRHFGNKHGLLLAVLQECLQKYLVLAQVGESLMVSDISSQSDLRRFLKYYIQSSLRALESVPELVRSLVGEAGQYPAESRQALAQGINQVNQTIATAINDVLANSRLQYTLPPIKLANLLNTCILGYAVITLTSDVHTIWRDRDDFVNTLVDMFVHEVSQLPPTHLIIDIPSETVREILLQAKKCGVKDYAIAYLLFGAGLTAVDITCLRVTDYQIQANHGVLRIKDTSDQVRSVPVNQKILGHRYGSATNNPLSAYLKSRKQEIKERYKGVQGEDALLLDRFDLKETMFLSSNLQPLSLEEIEQMWSGWTQNYSNLDGTPLTLMQSRHTWCIEMLARGIDADSFCIIGGIKPKELKAYQTRLNEKLAIDKAIALDS